MSLVSRGPLLECGLAPSCLSDAAARKMDGVQAARLFSGKQCLTVRLRLVIAIVCPSQ
jgi:hypothetical protein